jgi:hypothetical protein
MMQLGLMPGMALRQSLECRLCRQTIRDDKQLPFNSILILKYKMCPKCRQPVSEKTADEFWYRSRWYRFTRGVRKRCGWDSRSL